MKMKQKLMIIISAGHNVLWFVLFIMSIVDRVTYIAPEDAEPFDAFMSEGIYNVLILVTFMGLVTSALLSLSLIWGRKVSNSESRNLYRIQKSALIVAGIDNLLFYLSVVLLFWINKDEVIFVFLMWFICFIVCVVLLIILKWKIRKIGAETEN